MATTYPADIDNLRFVEAVMNLTLEYDMYDEILWFNKKGGGFRAAVMCNDIFFWGTADAEDLTPETLPALTQAYKDCSEYEDCANYGGLLYCARQRKLRPQGAFYKVGIASEIYHLFDACGPEREIDLLNPENQQGEYLYTREEEE